MNNYARYIWLTLGHVLKGNWISFWQKRGIINDSDFKCALKGLITISIFTLFLCKWKYELVSYSPATKLQHHSNCVKLKTKTRVKREKKTWCQYPVLVQDSLFLACSAAASLSKTAKWSQEKEEGRDRKFHWTLRTYCKWKHTET